MRPPRFLAACLCNARALLVVLRRERSITATSVLWTSAAAASRAQQRDRGDGGSGEEEAPCYGDDDCGARVNGGAAVVATA